MNTLARILSRDPAPSGRLTAAQKHEAQRAAYDTSAAISAVQWATCDMSADDLADALIATLEARPDLTRLQLEALERRVGRLAVQVSGHRIVDNARRAGL